MNLKKPLPASIVKMKVMGNHKFVWGGDNINVYRKTLDIDNQEYWELETTYRKPASGAYTPYVDPSGYDILKDIVFNEK